MRTFTDSSSLHEMPKDQADLIEHWSHVLHEKDLESLARWARDANVGDTRRIGRVTIYCVDISIKGL